MNLVRYDAMAVGNHEFNFGLERLEKSRREARFPWLSANIVGEDGKPAFAPYLVKEVAGLRVGILGLTTKNIPFWEPPAHIAGLKFLDTVETAKRYVPILRGKERCDASSSSLTRASSGIWRRPRRTALPPRTRPTPSRRKCPGSTCS